jgi:ADP-ribose pyrophosphatase YjhB (NUDIX family)
MYNFCTVCGAELQTIQLPTEDRPRLVCVDCGHIQYINPKIVSGTLPVEDGRVWLLRRGIEPRIGFWTHPAGYQEIDETTEKAAVRETLEELGCDVALDGLVGVYSRANSAVVNIVYLGHFVPPRLVPVLTLEALEVRSFSAEELPWEELAFPSTELILKDWLRSME